ncbi:unnamed protein product [Timema podura]|uniref:Timeless N-terminal domain-containing protein n=1 Tax=Timema podura TaxID=61482 RepID=A0ABN7NJL8_TIMPD|nr:unnamed protein product [Timema podura]
MEWMIINPLQVHSTFALGSQVGDFYVPSEDCLITLGEILQKLQSEDKVFCAFRRTLGFAQVIKKDLLPLFINVKDVKIVDAVLKILVNLTLPVECLLRTDMLCKTDAGRITVFEVNHLLITCKEAFVDPRCTSRLVGYMRGFLDKLLLGTGEPFKSLNQPSTNQCACALQPEASRQAYWAVTMVQVIALMYKDQRVGTLQKMLNQWFESSLSDSSEDEESNTSPSEQNSGASSLLTSDPTSDSSDNGGGPQNIKLVHCPAKINTDYKDSQSGPVVDNQLLARVMPPQSNPNKSGVKCPSKSQPGVSHSRRNSIGKRVRSSEEESGVSSFQSSTESKSGCSSKVNILRGQKRCLSSSELSDYGYGTQVENHEFISTSSNEDECLQMRLVHQKPHIIKKSRNKTDPGSKDKLELRRKKLVKRSRTNM